MAFLIGASGTATVTGTADADIIVFEESGAAAGLDVGTGGGGNDVMIGDIDVVFVDDTAGNSTIATARDIDTSGRWSTQSNPLVSDDAIPYVTVLGLGQDAFDVFAVTVGAGQSLIADIDFGGGLIGGNAMDSELKLLNSAGAVLASNDDNSFLDDGLGSPSSLDSYLTWINSGASAQTVYIRVEQFNDSPVNLDDTYLLGVSVTGHANTNVANQGSDSLSGGAGDDYIVGNDGNDTLSGGADNDTIIGGEGNDRIFTGSGRDLLGVPDEIVVAGNGSDTVFDGTADNELDLGAGNDAVVLSTGDDTVLGGTGNDTLQLSSAAALSAGDILSGGADDTADAVDLLNGSAGAYDFAALNISGFEIFNFVGLGTDITVRFTAAQILQFAGAGGNSGFGIFNRANAAAAAIDVEMSDLSSLDLSGLILQGWTDDDQIAIAGDGDGETITGTARNDAIAGNGGADNLSGDAGADTLLGGLGGDTLFGGTGNDSLEGGDNGDSLMGGLDNDTLVGGAGNDTLDGGAGADTAVFAAARGDHARALSGDDIVLTRGGDTDVIRSNVETIAFGDQTVGYDTLAAVSALTRGRVDTGVFGNRVNGQTDVNGRISYTFEGAGGDLRLDLKGFDIDSGEVVDVLVNGSRIGALGLGVNDGFSDDTLTISAADQVAGENTLVFVQQMPTFKWGVSDVVLRTVVDAYLTLGETETGSYGNRFNGTNDTDGTVTASVFVESAADLVLSLEGFDIDTGNEVEVRINGHTVARLDAGVNDGLAPYRLAIDSALVTPAAENFITFHQLTDPNFKWGVTNLRVAQADAELTPGTIETGSYGNRFNGATAPDGEVTMTFERQGTGDLVLQVTGFDIDVADDVEVFIGETRIGTLRDGVDQGLSRDAFVLSADILPDPGTEAVLTFRQTANTGFAWGVTDILVEPIVEDITRGIAPGDPTFGNRYNGETDANGRVSYSFDGLGNDLRLSLNGFDIDSADEVEVLVNGQSAGFLSETANQASGSTVLQLDGDLQRAGGNVLTFVQTQNPNFQWGGEILSLTTVVDQVLFPGAASTADFGNRFNGNTDTDGKLVFAFDPTDYDRTLDFRGFDIDTATEVRVLLNGAVLATLPAGVNDGFATYQLAISAEDQVAGENVIVFEQLDNPNFKWGVADVVLNADADATLTPGTVETGEFGNNFNGATAPDGEVLVTFKTDPGEAVPASRVLVLNGFDIDSFAGGEVTVALNGTGIGILNDGTDNGLAPFAFVLDSDLLAFPGDENVLTFTQAINPNFKWGVTDLMVDTPVADITSATATGSYGNRFNGATDADGDVFVTFDGNSATALSVSGFDIDSATEVEVHLNGTSIGFLGVTPNNGQATTVLALPTAELNAGGNVLTFEQTVNDTYAWGFTDAELIF